MSAEDVKQGTETWQNWQINWESALFFTNVASIEVKVHYGIKPPATLSGYLIYIFQDKTARECW